MGVIGWLASTRYIFIYAAAVNAVSLLYLPFFLPGGGREEKEYASAVVWLFVCTHETSLTHSGSTIPLITRFARFEYVWIRLMLLFLLLFLVPSALVSLLLHFDCLVRSIRTITAGVSVNKSNLEAWVTRWYPIEWVGRLPISCSGPCLKINFAEDENNLRTGGDVRID